MFVKPILVKAPSKHGCNPLPLLKELWDFSSGICYCWKFVYRAFSGYTAYRYALFF